MQTLCLQMMVLVALAFTDGSFIFPGSLAYSFAILPVISGSRMWWEPMRPAQVKIHAGVSIVAALVTFVSTIVLANDTEDLNDSQYQLSMAVGFYGSQAALLLLSSLICLRALQEDEAVRHYTTSRCAVACCRSGASLPRHTQCTAVDIRRCSLV
eukprot:SAG11_NODE_4640_length_1825_cov_0.957706_2_plen_155_part_00